MFSGDFPLANSNNAFFPTVFCDKPLPGANNCYNDGHGFIRGRAEHPFAALYTWAVCRDVSSKLGMNREEQTRRSIPLVGRHEDMCIAAKS